MKKFIEFYEKVILLKRNQKNNKNNQNQNQNQKIQMIHKMNMYQMIYLN